VNALFSEEVVAKIQVLLELTSPSKSKAKHAMAGALLFDDIFKKHLSVGG
jgi:hypothetical protein